MPHALVHFIALYGYPAIFLLIFIQELGVPGFPGELLLLYFGYLSKAILFFPFVCLVVVAADLAGSYLLYLVIRRFSSVLLLIKPKWLFASGKKIFYLRKKIAKNKLRAIFLGRLTPFVRGYIPAIAGFLQINPAFYFRTASFPSLLWNGAWLFAGWLLSIKSGRTTLLFATIAALVIVSFYLYIRKLHENRIKNSIP